MAYAMMKAYAEGQVDEDKYGDAGLRAFNGIVSGYVSNDALGNVYRSSGASASAEDYMNASLYVVNEAKGVGPLMMAAVYANDAAEKYNRPKPHVHEWSYSADGSTLTVT
jgi:rhamnogalacturonyl hydrolase YesR